MKTNDSIQNNKITNWDENTTKTLIKNGLTFLFCYRKVLRSTVISRNGLEIVNWNEYLYVHVFRIEIYLLINEKVAFLATFNVMQWNAQQWNAQQCNEMKCNVTLMCIFAITFMVILV